MIHILEGERERVREIYVISKEFIKELHQSHQQDDDYHVV